MGKYNRFLAIIGREPIAPKDRKSTCPCGSTEKYKFCCGSKENKKILLKRRKKFQLSIGLVILLAVFGVEKKFQVFSLFGDKLSGIGSTNYASISGLDVSALNDKQRNWLMKKTNRVRCICGCGMTLAQCINTDMTCPLRNSNSQRARKLSIKAMERFQTIMTNSP